MITTLPKSLLEASSLLLEASLYESILLLENRIEFLKKNNPSIDTSHDHLAIFNKPDEIIDHFANVGDPTKNKQHTQWILGQYKKKNIRQEDMYRVHDALSNFDKYKSKLDKKDINQYKTLGELESAVHPHKGTAATNSEAKQETISKGRTLIHDNGKGLKVYRLEPNEEGKKASQEIYGGGHAAGGTHTSWCTAARSEQCMFDHYSKDEPLHVIHTPSGKVYQAHPSTRQLMDAEDMDFMPEYETQDGSKMVTHEDTKHISKALDHIPNGWKLKFTHGFSTTSKKDIEHALNQDDDGIASAAALRENITPELAEKAAAHHSGTVRGAIARNPKTPEHIVTKLMKDKASLVREYAAMNTGLSSGAISKAYEDSKSDQTRYGVNVRANLLENPNASNDLLKKSFDEYETPHKEQAAMRNPNMNADTIRYAISKNPKLMHLAVEHPNAPSDVIYNATEDLGHLNQYTQIAAAQHQNATKESLHRSLDSSYGGVRAEAVQNKNADISHIERGLNDPEHHVVVSAFKSDLIQPHHVDKMLTHDDQLVKRAAIKKANGEQLHNVITNNPENLYILRDATSNKNILPKTIDYLADSSDKTHNFVAAEHEKLSAEKAEKLSHHENEDVRALIGERTDISHDIIRRLANDPSNWVRNRVKKTHGVSND